MLDSLPKTKREFDEGAVELPLSECEASPELVAAFNEGAIKVPCSADRILFRKGEAGNCVYLVRAGEVGLMLPISSTRDIGFRARAGSLVGLPAAFSKGAYSMTAVAWNGAELGVMSRDKFCDLIASKPALSLDVLRMLAAETRVARMVIADVGANR